MCVLKVSQSVSRVHVDALVASGVADLRWGSRGHKSLWRRERSSQKVSWAANVAVAAHEACARNDSGCKQVGFVLRNGRVPSLILIVRYFFGTILRSAARVHACMKLASERGVAVDLECTVAHVHVDKWFLSQTIRPLHAPCLGGKAGIGDGCVVGTTKMPDNMQNAERCGARDSVDKRSECEHMLDLSQ